jgi:DNA-binding NarL/FixJ family response regulator
MNPIRVLIADDHALVRGGIRALVEKIDDVVVVGEAGRGTEALDLVNTLNPGLILLDITMPDGSGFEVLDHVTKNYPEIKVIVLTVHEAVEYAKRAYARGAVGFLPKSAAPTELEQAIHTVVRGERYISPEISRNILFEISQGTTKEDLLATLSPRQREVLRLIAEGKTTKQIAHILEISVKTVETHRAQLMERLGIHDVAGLVRYAIIVGLLPLNDVPQL